METFVMENKIKYGYKTSLLLINNKVIKDEDQFLLILMDAFAYACSKLTFRELKLYLAIARTSSRLSLDYVSLL